MRPIAALLAGIACATAEAAAAAPLELPHGAKALKVFSDPLTIDRRVMPDEASWLYGPGHQDAWSRVGGVLLSQARHAVQGDPWVFIPGRYGLVVGVPSARYLTGGAYQDALFAGGGGQVLRCTRIEPNNFQNCLDDDGGQMDFFKLSPAWVRSARFGGRCFRARHGVVLGTLPYRAFNTIAQDFAAAVARWRTRSRATATCPRGRRDR